MQVTSEVLIGNITSAPVLAFPDFENRNILEKDASLIDVEAVLAHNKKIVMYIQSIYPAEKYMPPKEATPHATPGVGGHNFTSKVLCIPIVRQIFPVFNRKYGIKICILKA